jgi:hypothetical protein
MNKEPTVMITAIPFRGCLGQIVGYKRNFVGIKHVLVRIEGGPLFSGPRIVRVLPRQVKVAEHA